MTPRVEVEKAVIRDKETTWKGDDLFREDGRGKQQKKGRVTKGRFINTKPWVEEHCGEDQKTMSRKQRSC